MGPLISLFWTSGDVSSGFQSPSGQPIWHLPETCMVYFLSFTSGVTPLLVHTASIVAGHFPHMCVSAVVAASDQAARLGGGVWVGKKHEIYVAAFGSYLFYDLFL